MNYVLAVILALSASSAMAETRVVHLQEANGNRIDIATLEIDDQGAYSVEMNDESFANHFLSMRPFKCLEGPEKHWCHVPYPYDIKRNISDDLTDLEYDFLFVSKGSGEYGINMWNGVYYKLAMVDGHFVGQLHEMDMDTLSAPPPAGELRPVQTKDLHESDPDGHWLPQLVIE